MRCIELPRTDIRPSVVGLGTGSYGTGIPEGTALELMDRYVERGGNHIDTAHVYAAWVEGGWGASERAIGRWLASRGVRRQIALATKGAHHDIETCEKRMTREAIRQDLHESLDRLGTDRVELYWLHRDDPDVPVGEILSWLNEHLDAGLVRAIGCSNWTVARQREAASWARERGVVGFCASQVRWSLAEHRLPPGDTGSGMVSMDAGALAYHRETRLPVVAYSSQGRGFFSGKYAPGVAPDAPGVRKDVLARYGTEANFRRLAAAREIAAARGCSPNQVALAWLFHQPFDVCALTGARTVAQLADSCAAAELALTPRELAKLNAG
jgi:aryl-alcohol dehydrogenase-like predicted oxidoreductase